MIASIVANLFITAVAYLIFPCIYVAIKGKVSRKMARAIALVNSVICALAIEYIQTFFLYANDPTYKANFIPAIFYFGIAEMILQKKDNKDELK